MGRAKKIKDARKNIKTGQEVPVDFSRRNFFKLGAAGIAGFAFFNAPYGEQRLAEKPIVKNVSEIPLSDRERYLNEIVQEAISDNPVFRKGFSGLFYLGSESAKEAFLFNRLSGDYGRPAFNLENNVAARTFPVFRSDSGQYRVISHQEIYEEGFRRDSIIVAFPNLFAHEAEGRRGIKSILTHELEHTRQYSEGTVRVGDYIINLRNIPMTQNPENRKDLVLALQEIGAHSYTLKNNGGFLRFIDLDRVIKYFGDLEELKKRYEKDGEYLVVRTNLKGYLNDLKPFRDRIEKEKDGMEQAYEKLGMKLSQ